MDRSPQLDRALTTAEQIAAQALTTIRATAGRQARPGAKNNPADWVTDTDRVVEQAARRWLTDAFPQVGIWGEEFGNSADLPGLPGAPDGPDLLWVVDPVDGTSNYVAGYPWYCFSLGLLDAAGPAVGVIGEPASGVVWSAARGRGLFRDGTPFRPDVIQDLAGALVMAEPGPVGGPHDLSRLAGRCRDAHVHLRVGGSSALAVTQVALGRAAAAVLPPNGYHPWDVAGALALAGEAGLAVTDHSGRAAAFPIDGLVVSVPSLTSGVLALLAG